MKTLLKIVAISILAHWQISTLMFAQEIHFSQFNASPMFLNPALSGSTESQMRIGSNYRNQWASIIPGVPYLTYSLWGDAQFELTTDDTKQDKNKLGGGIIILKDKAGDGGLSLLNLLLSAAFHKKLDADERMTLSLGLQGGAVQRSFDNWGNLLFPDQTLGDGSGLNPNIPTMQPPYGSPIFYPDFSAGISWHFNSLGALQKILKLKVDAPPEYKFEVGVALQHLNRPLVSFTGNSAERMRQKWVFHTSSSFFVSDFLNISQTFLFMKRGPANQFNTGIELEYIVNNIPSKKISFFAGPYLRLNDALIMLTGFQYHDWRFGVSYDVNISSLKTITRGRGGLEFSLIYTHYKVLKNKLKCPRLIEGSSSYQINYDEFMKTRKK